MDAGDMLGRSMERTAVSSGMVVALSGMPAAAVNPPIGVYLLIFLNGHRPRKNAADLSVSRVFFSSLCTFYELFPHASLDNVRSVLYSGWRCFSGMVTRYRFVLLAPAEIVGPIKQFARMERDRDRYEELLDGLRLLRGRTYLQDGAIAAADLDANGRYAMPGDEECWHLLLLDEADEVIGCVRLRVHSGSAHYGDLRVQHSALAKDASLGPRVRAAIEADLALAKRHGLQYAEIGGWALAKAWRGTKAALDILAASYALGELWGGCLGVATATFRHGSASILKKMGAEQFVVDGEELPPYEDSQYGCTMELLRFTRRPAQKFCALIDPLKKALVQSPVIGARMAPANRMPELVPEAEVA
jgi:hypothetical protein